MLKPLDLLARLVALIARFTGVVARGRFDRGGVLRGQPQRLATAVKRPLASSSTSVVLASPPLLPSAVGIGRHRLGLGRLGAPRPSWAPSRR